MQVLFEKKKKRNWVWIEIISYTKYISIYKYQKLWIL